MDVWDWVLAAYGQPGVPEASLTLQDQYGQNTAYLLWAVWAEVGDPMILAQAAAAAKSWDAVALTPLRNIRRALKAPHPPVEDRARESLREDVKAAELRAEQLLMETLAQLADGNGGTPALQALEAASAAWGTPAPPDALAALAAALR